MCVLKKIVVVFFILFKFFPCNGKNYNFSGKTYIAIPSLFHLDDYDKCMSLEEEALYCTFTFHLGPSQSENNSFVWKMIQIINSNPKNYEHDRLRHGICVPISCPNSTSLSVKERIENCYNEKYFNIGLTGNVTNLSCKTSDVKYPIDIYDIVIGAIFIFYLTFVVFASFYEGIARYQSKDVYEEITGTLGGKIIAAFSIPKNVHRLAASANSSDIRKLRSIQGIRFYNLMCIIMSHTLMISFAYPIANTEYVENLTNKPLNMFVANGNYAVQSFFVISGWLLSFHFFQMAEERKTVTFLSLVKAFVNRYMRLTPTLVAAIAFESTWFVHTGDGPNWEFAVAEDYKNCRKNWWTNLLFVNNYVDPNNMCLHQTWYIAADTQLYLFSLVLLWLMWKYERKVKLIISLTIITGLLIQGGIAFYKEHDIVIRQYSENLYNLQGIRDQAWHDLYTPAYSSIVGYTIGLSFGYIFYKTRNKVFVPTKIQVILWWIFSFGLCIFIILIASIMYQPNFKSTNIESAFYWALGKNLFALGIALGILGFTVKIGWFARWFCEWKPVNVLGRVTYSTYIIHVTVMRIRAGFLRSPLYVNDYVMFTTTLGDITLSYLIGTAVCLLFEMPISALQKLMLPQMKPKSLKEFHKPLGNHYAKCDCTVKDSTLCSKV